MSFVDVNLGLSRAEQTDRPLRQLMRSCSLHTAHPLSLMMTLANSPDGDTCVGLLIDWRRCSCLKRCIEPRAGVLAQFDGYFANWYVTCGLKSLAWVRLPHESCRRNLAHFYLYTVKSESLFASDAAVSFVDVCIIYFATQFALTMVS